MYYEDFFKHRAEPKGYFDEIFPPYDPDKEYIKKYDLRCKKCQKSKNWKIWKNYKDCYSQNEEGAIFKNAYGNKEWIPWKTFKT